jgi:hypothetical protein
MTMIECSEINKFTYGGVQYKKARLLTEDDIMGFDTPVRVFVNDQIGNLAPKKRTGVLKFGYLKQGRWVIKDDKRMRESAKHIEILEPDTEIYLAVERLPNEIIKKATPLEIANMLKDSIPLASLTMDGYTPIVWFNNGQNHVIYLGIDGKYNVYGLGHVKLEGFFNIKDCIQFCHSQILG